LTINALATRRVLQRVLLGLGFGALLALVQVQWNLGFVFLVALCAAAAILPFGLGLGRFPVALAVWVGQYSVIWLRVVAPSKRADQTGAIPYILNGIIIFMPTVAVVAGAFFGLMLERNRRSAPRPQA
jgi:hypothetical protein